MITPAAWMPTAVEALKHAFGCRLRFVGLQGSYRRGEATEASDIDICVILDRLAPEDVAALRAALDRLPEGEKAAGFIAGVPQLRAWPAFEIFAFAQDMDAWHGDLAPLLPPLAEADIRLGCRTAVAALYHEAAQTLLAAPRLAATEAEAARHSLGKAFLRALQGVIFLRKGEFPRDRAQVVRLAAEEDAGPLRKASGKAADGPAALGELAAACLAWSGARLAALSEEEERA